jgi:hypothetical protein
MVNIRIIIEGGILPGDNVDAATFDNSEKFRESFHKLLSGIFDPAGFDLEIRIGAGNKMASKSFKQLKAEHNCILLIDLDRHKSGKSDKIIELE